MQIQLNGTQAIRLLSGFVGLTIIIYLVAYRGKIASFFNLFKTFVFNSKAKLSAEQQFAIACGAHLTMQNGSYINSLSTGLNKGGIKQMIRERWGISTRDDAIDTMLWLSEGGGHRVYFDMITSVKSEYSDPAEQKIKITELSEDYGRDLVEYSTNLTHGARYLTEEGIASAPIETIIARDYGRLINIARWSYDLKLINEQEAWDFIMGAAKVIQSNYPSWEQMGASYLLGRIMWGGLRNSGMSVNMDNHKSLLEDSLSPWKFLDWKMKL